MEYRAGNVAQLMHKILGSVSSNGHNGAYLSIIPALSGGRGGSEVKGHPQLNIESELSLCFEALSQKEKEKPEGLTPVGHWLATWQRIFKEITEACK